MIRNKIVNVKEQIIDKSIHLFLDKGYNATTIKDITDAVNITKGAFYWHFKSKDELLETIVSLFESNFTDSVIREVNNSQGTFLNKLKYTHKWVTEFAYRHRDLCVGFLTIAAEMVGSGTNIEEKIRTVYTKYIKFIREILELGKKEGSIRDDLDINMIAHVINAMHNGSLLEWHINYDDIDGALFARTYRDVSLFGIIKQGGKKK
jgi:AcrR family transcriptional regulator